MSSAIAEKLALALAAAAAQLAPVPVTDPSALLSPLSAAAGIKRMRGKRWGKNARTAGGHG